MKGLNKQVRRNARRFPQEFSLTLTNQEAAILKSHFATSSWGGKHKPPRVFTEHGAIMAATILHSSRAIEMSVYVVQAFVQLRDMLSANAEIARRLGELERKFGSHDRAILEIPQALRQLTQPAAAPKHRRIGFVRD